MSEKRLTYVILMNNYYQIREVDDDGYCRRLSPTGIIDLLNKQQAIIRRDEISIKTMMSNMEKLEGENEQLRKDKAILKERLRECGMRLDRFNCR